MKKIRSKKELQQLVANIRKDFEEYAVNEVGFQIEQAYESCIQKFYEDYPGNGKNPKYYNRTYSTYEGSNAYHDTFKRMVKIKTDKGYKVGIRVAARYINGQPYQNDKGWVFDRTWKKGIHGTREIGIMSPTPQVLMRRWFRKFKKTGAKKILRDATKYAVKKNLR